MKYLLRPLWILWAALAMGALGCGSDGSSCKSDDDCSPGFFCRTDSLCKAGCRLSIECPAGQVCKINQCIDVQKDEDEDGFPFPLDCDDDDRLVNPGLREICNNKKDDNCDGQVDEKGCVTVDCRPGETRECYEGKENTLTFPGTRCKRGRQVCASAGVWGDCQGQILPAPEICDGQDNDCNGKVDDGDKGTLTRPCYNGPDEKRGRGECKEGTQTCNGGKWSACAGEVTPKTEACTGKDDDCNGQIDDAAGVGDDCDSGEKGICQKGKKACDPKTQKVVCKALQEASKEQCGNQLDDDCNGVIDDDCPFTPRKIASLPSFPHYVAISGDRAAVSLRDSQKVALFDLSATPPKKLQEIAVAAAPFGLQFEQKKLYVTTAKSLYAIDTALSSPTAQEVVTFAGESHAGGLWIHSSRAYTRRLESGPGLQLCQTDLSTQKEQCASLPGPFSHVGAGVGLSGVFALVLSDRGIHRVDILSLKQDANSPIKALAAMEDIAIDEQTKLAVVTSPGTKKLAIVDLSQGQVVASLELKDDKGQLQTPGRVVAAGGQAYVGHRDGSAVSVVDLVNRKITRSFEVCLAPQGMAIGPPDAQKGPRIWVSCPGDNSVWSFRPGP